MSDKIRDFFDAVERVAEPQTPHAHVLATIDPAYTTGDPKVTFDGETVVSAKPYKSVVPVAANARVVMQRVGSTWVVSGVLSGGPVVKAADSELFDGEDSSAFARRTETSAIRQAALAQAALTGGGIVTWLDNKLKWSQRFIAISVGRGAHWTVNGHYSFNMPASGTVIPGYGGASNVTVDAGGVTIPAWHTLYAVPTIGGDSTAYSYAISHYAADFDVPDHWILLAAVNSDDGRLRLGTGEVIDAWKSLPLVNGFTHYDDPWGPARYCKDGRTVHLRGLVNNGAVGTTAFTLPVGYRPYINVITSCVGSGNTGVGHLRIHRDGSAHFSAEGIFSTGWMSVSVAPFLTEG